MEISDRIYPESKMTTAVVDPPGPAAGLRFLEPYRRITSTGQFIPEIDGLRFIAIFSVYIFHLASDVYHRSSPGYSDSPASNGLYLLTSVLNVGVPLFFVISGFILGLPFAEAHRNLRKPVSLKKYFLRRVTRLEPPYILCLLLFFIFKGVTTVGAATRLVPNLIASIFYMHNSIFGRESAINGVAWSLEVEVQFYILAPVLALAFAIPKASIRRPALASLVLLATGLCKLVSSSQVLHLSLLAHAQYFLAGFIMAEVYLSDGARRRRHWLWDLISLGGWPLLLALLVRDPGGVWGAPSWLPWLLLLLTIAAFQGVVVNRFVTNPWIATVGGMCYTIYLLHVYIIVVVERVTEPIGGNAVFPLRLLIQCVLVSPILLTISAAYFRVIERPCMRPDWPWVKAAFPRVKSLCMARVQTQVDDGIA